MFYLFFGIGIYFGVVILVWVNCGSLVDSFFMFLMFLFFRFFCVISVGGMIMLWLGFLLVSSMVSVWMEIWLMSVGLVVVVVV